MNRIKIDLPEESVFSMDYKVRIDDINYGNHLGNDRLLVIAQQARLEYFQSLGYKDELDFGGDIGIIVSDAAIVFKAEAFLGDCLRVEISMSGKAKYGFDMYYRVLRTESSTPIAILKTGILFMDYSTKKLSHIPTKAEEKLIIT